MNTTHHNDLTLHAQLACVRALLDRLAGFDPEQYDHRFFRKGESRCVGGIAADAGIGGLTREGVCGRQVFEPVFGQGSWDAVFSADGQRHTWIGEPGWKAAMGALRAWELVMGKRVQEATAAGSRDCVHGQPAEPDPTPDPETVAYIAIGAASVWDPEQADDWSGQIGFVNTAISYAQQLDDAFAPMIEAGDFTWVFAYEVAEEFGTRWGKLVLDHDDACPADEAADTVIRQLLREARDEAAPKPAAKCARCDSALSPAGLCSDETCPFSDYPQSDARGWSGHPDRANAKTLLIDEIAQHGQQTQRVAAEVMAAPDTTKYTGSEGNQPKPITPDTVLYVGGTTPIVSYGPRRETPTDTVPCHESEAAFWSVFTHNVRGEATILADCVRREDAASVATLVHRQAEREANLTRANAQQALIIDGVRGLVTP